MNIDEMQAFMTPGRDLGVTAWEPLPQDMLTQFEVLTKSNDPLHTDPQWVQQHTDYPGTIAPGFLTLSLLPYFVQQLDLTPPGYHALNYGFDKIRWIAPVPVDSRVRATFTAGGVKNRISGQPGYVVQYDVSLEVEGLQRPAMVAQWLGAIVPDADTAGGD